MKTMKVILLLTAAVLMVSSCDFFRTLAGRPTSADIEAKRDLIAVEEMAHQARIDSLARVKKQLSDSLAVLDSLKMSASNIIPVGKIGASASAALSYRYYIVVGAFSNKDNATNFSRRLEAEGYQPAVFPYRNGFTAVGICPSNTLKDVFASLKEVKTKKFCPADAWILVNE